MKKKRFFRREFCCLNNNLTIRPKIAQEKKTIDKARIASDFLFFVIISLNFIFARIKLHSGHCIYFNRNIYLFLRIAHFDEKR